MNRTLAALGAVLLALGLGGSAAPASAAGTAGPLVVAGDNLHLLRVTWECGSKLRDGRTPKSWVHRFSFVSGTGAHLTGYDMRLGKAPERVSATGQVALRCAIAPTARQLGYSS